MIKANYHTHTRWCNHANGEIEDYIKEAISKGLEEVAITEHVCLDMTSPRRLKWNEFHAYNDELDFMKKKYENQIKVIKGFECEYFPYYLHKYQELKDKYGYELFVLGQHENFDRDVDYFSAKSKEDVIMYADNVVEALNTGFFKICAHPDVILASYFEDEFVLEQIDRVYKACQENDVYVEINANGYRENRPYPSFNSLESSKKFDLTYVVGSDCHEVHHMVDEKLMELYQIALKMGLNVVDKIKL